MIETKTEVPEMNILPISDYPASSDANSQIQVLSEEKSEISVEIQRINDSGLDSHAKEAAVDSLRARSDNIKQNIRKKQADIDNEKRLDKKRLEKRDFERKQLEKQDADKSRLDIKV